MGLWIEAQYGKEVGGRMAAVQPRINDDKVGLMRPAIGSELEWQRCSTEQGSRLRIETKDCIEN